MDLKVEAQRVMAVALGKMYNSRLQRGGIRLHKSLLLSLVLRSARDIYLNVRAEQQDVEAGQGDKLEAEAMEVEDGERGAERKGEECIQPRDCIQSDSGCNQPRDCIHCDRDRVSECPQLSVPEPGARDPCVRPREAARRPGLTRDRKRRKGSDQRDPPDPECLPSKRARLEEEEEEPRSLVRVRGLGKAAADSPREQPLSPGHLCRHRALGKRGIWVRVVVAY